MKYNTPEDKPEVFDDYIKQIKSYFDPLIAQYEKGGARRETEIHKA